LQADWVLDYCQTRSLAAELRPCASYKYRDFRYGCALLRDGWLLLAVDL
jgi:hypothetical protein